jgi:hypothetical protein
MEWNININGYQWVSEMEPWGSELVYLGSRWNLATDYVQFHERRRLYWATELQSVSQLGLSLLSNWAAISVPTRAAFIEHLSNNQCLN